jgi:hypothetical protein
MFPPHPFSSCCRLVLTLVRLFVILTRLHDLYEALAWLGILIDHLGS